MVINIKPSFLLSLKIKIIRDLGYNLTKESTILDFGCGSGEMVQELRELGYVAFGCGTRFSIKNNIDTSGMMGAVILREIDLQNYVLPFENNTFDFVFSHSVFEHVQNYPEAINEISRVLKPDGFCLHTFASRYKPIEAHVLVPFASIIRSHWWLYLWSFLGIRNEWQDCHSVRERSYRFYNYLKEETNYLSKKQLSEQFKRQFKNVLFCENLWIKYSSKKGKYLFSISKILPILPHFFGTFRSRVIFTSKPYKNSESDCQQA
jgi:SAM-dependent methyltransferase